MSDTTSIVMRRLGGEEDMLRCVVREIVRFGRNRNSAAAVSCSVVCFCWGCWAGAFKESYLLLQNTFMDSL